ncbi:hypothetical protein BDV35DRAFT_354763 [Aspergillus flavus]|uniref:Uncharacterized protein n=1 Tax=Aspergillus flavus TaxID=5059 RepID=A0A5N6GUW9_ASPFL|nr:hypothetical protein BDV35DRAFT_354763 [Aspergillus flavus]
MTIHISRVVSSPPSLCPISKRGNMIITPKSTTTRQYSSVPNSISHSFAFRLVELELAINHT